MSTDPGASLTQGKPLGAALRLADSNEHSRVLSGVSQGKQEVSRDEDTAEEPVGSDAVGLIWPVLLVVAVLLAFASQQFWPRKQAFRSDDTVSPRLLSQRLTS